MIITMRSCSVLVLALFGSSCVGTGGGDLFRAETAPPKSALGTDDFDDASSMREIASVVESMSPRVGTAARPLTLSCTALEAAALGVALVTNQWQIASQAPTVRASAARSSSPS